MFSGGVSQGRLIQLRGPISQADLNYLDSFEEMLKEEEKKLDKVLKTHFEPVAYNVEAGVIKLLFLRQESSHLNELVNFWLAQLPLRRSMTQVCVKQAWLVLKRNEIVKCLRRKILEEYFWRFRYQKY